MIPLDKSLLSRLLQVRPPWEVRDFRIDEHTRTCDVLIGLEPERRGWFGRTRRPNPWGETTHRWEHLPLCGMKLALIVALPNGVDVKRTAWMGDRGMPFTRPLAHRVFAYFKEGVSLQSVCRLLDLPLQDLWRYRLALDTGRAGAHGESAAAVPDSGFAPRSSQPAVTSILPASGGPVEGAGAQGGVPQWDHPVWLELINGELPLDIKMFSLKLMLSRVRSQLAVITDDEVRELKIRELHRYFVKNARMLGHELKQLEVAH